MNSILAIIISPFVELLFCFAFIVLGEAALSAVYRAWKLTKFGPSDREFAYAIKVIRLFIWFHNRAKPNRRITSIQISPSGAAIDAQIRDENLSPE